MLNTTLIKLNKELNRLESEITTAKKWNSDLANIFISEREYQIEYLKMRIKSIH
ncbi:hypothetical protein mgb1_037 [Bacillus phage MG-B1]|uniref:Uncharacterized protein n=1 Tax=Bacillus phage MG-B1 TaxID=1309583 RepID=M4WNK1_9CAUD|nr:hypothetical protein mgb1_037 [Bacillus phage MG-B1]AGI10626.1 hypothetical protein mgb1_037 [Bacillus phage MG-B1]